MTMLRDVLAELIGMFLGDVGLSIAILAVVAVSAALIELADVEPLLGGAVLLGGCLALVLESARRAARHHEAAATKRSTSRST